MYSQLYNDIDCKLLSRFLAFAICFCFEELGEIGLLLELGLGLELGLAPSVVAGAASRSPEFAILDGLQVAFIKSKIVGLIEFSKSSELPEEKSLLRFPLLACIEILELVTSDILPLLPL